MPTNSPVNFGNRKQHKVASHGYVHRMTGVFQSLRGGDYFWHFLLRAKGHHRYLQTRDSDSASQKCKTSYFMCKKTECYLYVGRKCYNLALWAWGTEGGHTSLVREHNTCLNACFTKHQLSTCPAFHYVQLININADTAPSQVNIHRTEAAGREDNFPWKKRLRLRS